MTLLHEIRGRMRELLAWHYMGGIEFGDSVAAWLLEFGGWMPDPQEVYGDATPLTQPLDQGLYTPCLDIERAIADAAELFDLIEIHNINGSAPGAREEVGQPREGQALPGCPEEGDSSDAESNQAVFGAAGTTPDF